MRVIRNVINEETLYEEIRNGNEKAFAYLFDNYYNNLCRYVFSYTRDFSQAEDIVQGAMITIWDNRKRINSKLSVKNYLYKIVYNKFIDDYRKNKLKLNYLDEVKKSSLDNCVEFDDEYMNIKNEIIQNEIHNLPPKCKEVFILNKKHGLKYKEVAEELNISIKTVEIHISKALKIIRNKFKESDTINKLKAQ